MPDRQSDRLGWAVHHNVWWSRYPALLDRWKSPRAALKAYEGNPGTLAERIGQLNEPKKEIRMAGRY